MHALQTPELDAPPLLRYGLPERVTGANPAAGADFSQAVDGRFFTRLVSVFCRLVTDGNAANREVVLSFEDTNGNRYALAGINAVVAASSTADYAFNAFQPEVVATVDSTALVPIPPMLLLPTDVFKLHVVNIQATDQLSRIRFVWERFYTTDQPRRFAPSGP